MIQKRKINKINIKSAFEYFNGLMTKPGEKAEYSMFVFNNYSRLLPIYNSISNEIYDPNKDQELQAYNGKVRTLAVEYAKLDEAGKPVLDTNKNVIIDDAKSTEFNEKLTALNKENEALLNSVREKQAKNGEILQQVVEIDIDAITISQFIPSAPPFIVGLFAYGTI
jgi:hypothetical protein